ncbi:GNAT family N-acetyltransferase [Leisingera sp. S232]|uniref:GNAT family N-acetyltransferase n=1 Tax=Leisingera sp. S232 TaxID=3415132 RepID=UPI00086D65F3|nr:GNAT family N-acetyltransferase [Rhodobacteraceae bacterium (ex Bugula neritina AB1)]
MPESQSAAYRLRPLEPDDFADLASWFQNVADLARFDRSARAPAPAARVQETWEPGGVAAKNPERCWFSVTTDTGVLCGVTGLEGISAVNRDAVISLFVEESRRRQGIGIRSMALVLDFAFRQIGLNRVTSYYRADNAHSQQMTSRAGFAEEGRMREAWFAEGRYFDMVGVGILRRDWDARRGALAQELGPECRVEFRGAAVSGWVWPPGPPGAQDS